MTPFLPAPELEVMGYAIAIYPTTPYFAAIGAMRDVLQTLAHARDERSDGGPHGDVPGVAGADGRSEAMDYVRRFEPEEEHVGV